MSLDVENESAVGAGMREFDAGMQKVLDHDSDFMQMGQILRQVEASGRQLTHSELDVRELVSKAVTNFKQLLDPKTDDTPILNAADALSPDNQNYAFVEVVYLKAVELREAILMAFQAQADHLGDVALHHALPELVDELFAFERKAFEALWPDNTFEEAYERIMTIKDAEFSSPDTPNFDKLPEDERMESLRAAGKTLSQYLSGFNAKYFEKAEIGS